MKLNMKKTSDLVRDFKQYQSALLDLHKQTPRIIGKLGVDCAKQNIDSGGFMNYPGNVRTYTKRTDSTNKLYDKSKIYKGSVYSSKNKLLKQSGDMYDAITFRAGTTLVNIGVNLNQIPYAKMMNEGGLTKMFGKHTVRIPARKFLGLSKNLVIKTGDELSKRRLKILKSWKISE
jgi:phage gpG-like protein